MTPPLLWHPLSPAHAISGSHRGAGCGWHCQHHVTIPDNFG